MSPKQPERLKHVAEKETSSNPSQLGDPVSVKAEVSNNVPTEGEQGSQSSSATHADSTSPEKGPGKQGNAVDQRPSADVPAKNPDGKEVTGEKHLRLKDLAEKKMEQGEKSGGNPSQLGDPISMKAETDDYEPPAEGDHGESDGQRQETGSSPKSKL